MIANDVASLYDQIGPALFVAVVWGLVFAGTGLLIGAFVPFITGDSLIFAAGIVAANFPDVIDIWVLAVGIGIFAWLGDQVGYTMGRHFGRPYLDKRQGEVLKKAISNAEKFYQAWGWWAVVVARFVPLRKGPYSSDCRNRQDELLQVLLRQRSWRSDLGVWTHSGRILRGQHSTGKKHQLRTGCFLYRGVFDCRYSRLV